MMLKLSLLIFALCSSLGVTVGQIVQNGQCDPNVQLVENFNIEQFSGTWYELQRSDSPEQNADCAAFDITSSNGVINVHHTGVNNNFQDDSTGTATLATSAKLTLDIPRFSRHRRATSRNPKFQLSGEAMDFWVVLTDYENFALAYSCENISPTQREVHVWVLGRQRQYATEMVVVVTASTLNNLFGIDLNTLRTIDHSDTACYVLPYVEPGNSVIIPGQCDTNIAVQQNFNVAAFTGTWHQIANYHTDTVSGACVRAQYTVGDGVVNVLNSQVLNRELRTISGTARVTSTDNSARLRVTLNVGNENREQDLYVLATDYTSYAISYSCQNLENNQRRLYSWILGRSRQLSQETQTQVNAVVNSILELNSEYFTNTDQSNEACFYFPEPSNQPVVFGGQCDMTIPAKQNFRPAEYMGLWHTIQSYPSSFQDGTCSNAHYELIDGVVDVLNTQVRDRTLDSIKATAVLASTDGSAKLRVTFPVAGTDLTVSTDYWVLETDYTSYAFVYSCSNVDANTMQVGSWKLSRTKALTATANTEIDRIINNHLVLDQRYYKTEDQSETGCFYFPTPQAGVPVVFPGQCDPTIGMQNFELTRFAGTWYETAAYPKEEQSGQCINHVYSVISNTQLSLVSSSIVDQFLGQTTGTLTSTDSSGRLTITIISDGQTITIPFWIVNTDYTDYALAYACVNRGNDFRAVWSWKLSRTKQLSAAGNTNINSAMENIVVLDNSYFERIDQSEQACFYLPEIPLGQPIILPGQCDANIRAIPNFNVGLFAGRWRLVQSYHSDFQSGTCNAVEYGQTSANVLTVTNSQVVNRELRSISGTATVSTDGTGVLTVSLPSVATTFEYIVLDTDYISYALAYGCQNIGNNQRQVWSWKLSRSNSLSDVANTAINHIINRIDVLNNRYYYTVDRSTSGCFYFPEPDVNTNVRFRGQCDPNIPVVQNFNAVAYMGLWHDIESYPMPFQSGTCPNARYTLRDGVVDVFNTQVVSQSLDTIDGTAVLVSTDGSAKLSVTFNVLGQYVTTNYWVLSTDYTSYAYVYSCQNIDDEFMSVNSWKLSRTKQLPALGVSNINAIMRNYDILDDRYYVQRDQTPEGCFHFPEPQPGVPVVFPGQCDNNINTMQNFQFSQFAGTWYEIEAYPKDEQTGQCVSHTYTHDIAQSRLNLVSSSVNELTLSETAGVVTGTGGRLNIAIVSNGQTINIPFWIIDTNYNDYALAYACVNRGNDYRAVWSWKLSRAQTLSAAGNTAINNAMANIDVLANQYFERIDHSNDACFYLPDLSLDEPVTFRGQCDESIVGMRNFDASRYLGRWRLIESYFAEQQTGTCNEARYTAATGASFEVVNSQVIGQQLNTITGTGAVASTDGSGKLIVTLTTSSGPVTAETYVLDTDYNSYTLLYSCRNIDANRRRVWSWKMSRTNSLTAQANTAIDRIMNGINVLNNRYFYIVDRSDAACFFYPTPNPQQPVIFPGQCDFNIPVQPNFNAQRYLGFWYDVESYPAAFQTGTCSNAMYSLNTDGSVHVENTQVVNQLLETWIGRAVVTSTDGSAKLDATFNVNGVDVTTKYWVLETDYDSYALVYSCLNIDAETRSVFSWKLSRQPQLTAAANTAINAVINRVNVLDNQYFITRGHTQEDCFFYPDNKGGDVILPGQCLADNAVQAVTNFDSSAFAGTWHEVSRFPSDLQNGECVATQFTRTTSGFDITKTFVNNERQGETNAQVTVANANRGVIGVNINEVPFNNVFILATDYNEYALAYSCRNLDNERKQIYSWKLSRSRAGLSDAANTVISQIVNDNIDLWEGYYRPTGQNHDACFHYPVFDQLPSIIELPGPCPTNIRGVANFNTNAYLGRWFEVKRYPARHQSGTCNRAVYGLDQASGRLTVSNAEVRADSLRSQSGHAVVASDGSGEMTVEFVINGALRTKTLLILATDYTSFSLVYTCADIDNGQRSRVSSWQLSRTRTQTDAAASQIATVIANTRGLTPEYYQTTSQSDEDCFYVPEININEAPRFRGQCETVTGQAGFDVQRYLGWWHEIERYAIDEVAGECRSSEYIQDGNTFRVVDTRVEGNEGTTVSGTIVATSDGRLRRSIPGRADQDIWVLATDYDTYALLYSCENIDDEYRRVWSAKHSRRRTLTPAALEAMAPAITANRVLNEQLYVTVDQQDSTCFHYPAVTNGQVIIPGQCDQNIPVVGNFEISDFAGTWYEIERYDTVDTSCIGSRSTYDQSSGGLSLVSYEYRDGGLVTREGSVEVTSSDGSARLSVTFPVEGTEETTTTNVSILATDYASYALAYTCTNVDTYRRQVRAWKLSRERTLSSAGAATINALTIQRQELHQPYFNQIEQRDDCPEPSSAFIVNSSIIVLLICAFIQRLV